MKKLFLTFFILLVFPFYSQAQVLQAVAGGTSSGGAPPSELALRAAYSHYEGNSITNVVVVTGDLIIVGYSFDTALNGMVCSDNASGGSNTYSKAGELSHGYSYNVSVQIFYAIAKGTETLTITLWDKNEAGISVHVVSGAHNVLAEVLDDFNSNWTADGTSHTSESVTTSYSDCYLFSYWAQQDVVSTVAEDGSGFTERTEVSGHVHASFDRIVSSTGTYSNSITSSATQGWVNLICAFRGL